MEMSLDLNQVFMLKERKGDEDYRKGGGKQGIFGHFGREIKGDKWCVFKWRLLFSRVNGLVLSWQRLLQVSHPILVNSLG